MARALYVPPWQQLGAGRELGGRVERVEQLVELGQRTGHGQGLAGGAADGVAGQVPAGVAPEVAYGEPLVAAGLHQRPGVSLHDGNDLADGRRGLRGPAGEGVGEVAEQPRLAQAATADHDPVAAGLGHHPQRVRGGPDVAVAQDRHAAERGLELGDGGPVGAAGVELLGGPGVQRDRRRALVLGPTARLQEGQVLVVDALAHLHRDGDGACRADRRAHQRPEQHRVCGQRRPTAAPGDLG